MSLKTPTPHGFSLSPDDCALLRTRPPQRALDWVASELPARSLVTAVRPLDGGTSSAVHGLTIENGSGPARALVLRRYVRADWLAEEPDVAEREAAVLQLLEDSSVSAPRLVGVDPTGAIAGVPAVLMTALPGQIRWARTGIDDWLRQLAEALPAIHAVSVPAGIPAYRPYELGKEMEPPPWTRYPRAWERAIEIYNGPPPADESFFIHRDYHPGNVLWSHGQVSGIVDWANASIGSPEADVGHCRGNVVGHLGSGAGMEAADRFLAHYVAVSGRDGYHPYWDIVTVTIGPVYSYGEPEPAIDDWIAAAVAEIG